jgi:hypothetical protein
MEMESAIEKYEKSAGIFKFRFGLSAFRLLFTYCSIHSGHLCPFYLVPFILFLFQIIIFKESNEEQIIMVHGNVMNYFTKYFIE